MFFLGDAFNRPRACEVKRLSSSDRMRRGTGRKAALETCWGRGCRTAGAGIERKNRMNSYVSLLIGRGLSTGGLGDPNKKKKKKPGKRLSSGGSAWLSLIGTTCSSTDASPAFQWQMLGKRPCSMGLGKSRRRLCWTRYQADIYHTSSTVIQISGRHIAIPSNQSLVSFDDLQEKEGRNPACHTILRNAGIFRPAWGQIHF